MRLTTEQASTRAFNKVVNGTPTTLRSVGAHYHWRYALYPEQNEEEGMYPQISLPNWLAPIIGAVLPILMGVYGEYKSGNIFLDPRTIDFERLVFMALLGFLGGCFVWVWSVIMERRRKKKA